MIKLVYLLVALSASAYASQWRFVASESEDLSLFFIDLSRAKPGKSFQVFTTLQIRKYPASMEEGGGRTIYTDMVADCEMHLTGIESATIYDSQGNIVSKLKPRDIVFTEPVEGSINQQWLAAACSGTDTAASPPIDPLSFAFRRWAAGSPGR